MTYDPREFRDALGSFATGVTVISAQPADGPPIGVTCNSFASVSLDPPLVLWCLRKASGTVPLFSDTGHFGVSILAESQSELSVHFAKRGEHKFGEVPHVTWTTGAPLLDGAVARFDCETVERVDAGDHYVFIGRVVRFDADATRAPLVFLRGNYSELVAASAGVL